MYPHYGRCTVNRLYQQVRTRDGVASRLWALGELQGQGQGRRIIREREREREKEQRLGSFEIWFYCILGGRFCVLGIFAHELY